MGGLLALAPAASSASAAHRPCGTVVLRALGLGDLLTAVPALRAVRRGLPGPVRLAAPAALAPLALLTGAVDEVVDTRGLGPLDRRLQGADVAVNLHGRGPESTALLAATRPAQLIAWADEPWDDGEHERVRWCRLLNGHGLPGDPDELDLELPGRQMHGAVLVHPGAAYGSRRWPANRWAAVAAALPGRVLVTGSAAERPLAEQVAAAAGLPADSVVAGTTDLLGLAQLVAGARLLLSADTGVAHLAVALGTPSVTLFGPASPARWRAPADRPQHRVLWAGSTGEVFAAEPGSGLLRLQVADVLAALQ